MANPLFTSGQAAQTMPSQAMQIIAPDLALQQTQLSRQQQLANMLRQQSLEPMGDTQTIGGWAIKKSPLEGLSKLAQALGSSYMQNKNDEQQLDLSKAFNQKLGITPQTPTDQASTDALNQGATVGDIGPTNSNAQRMGEILSRPSPQQNNRLPYEQLIGSLVAGEIGGAPAQTAFWKQHEPPPVELADRYMGITPDQTRQSEIAKRIKEGYIAPVAGRPGGVMISADGSQEQMPTAIDGSQAVKNPDGTWSYRPMAGATSAIQNATTAQTLGKTMGSLNQGVDANGLPTYVLGVPPGTVGAQGQPQQGAEPWIGQEPKGAFSGDQNAISQQISHIKDPQERAAAQRAFSNQAQGNPTQPQAAPQDQQAPIRPANAPGFNTFQDKISGTSADLANKTLTLASTAPARINILDNILDLSHAGVASGPGEDFKNSVKGYIANTPIIASAFPKGWKGSVSDYQELTKFMNQNASQAWQAAGGTGTDAQLDMQTKANVNNKMFPQALQGVAQWAKAGEMAAMTKANLMQKTEAMKSPQALQQFEMQWRNAFDPKAFQLQIMPPEEQQAFVKRLSPAAAGELAKKRLILKQMGAF